MAFNRTGNEIRAIHMALKSEPVAVVLMYQSQCDITGSTKPHLQAIAKEYGFLLVTLNCDHLSPEMAGLAIPSVTVFHSGVQFSPPLRGTRTREALIQFLVHYGVIDDKPTASGD